MPNFATGAFVDAMNDPHTCLAYTALTGKRKQSVSPAEKLLPTAVANQCKKNEFPRQAWVIEVIANWHKASDGRGLNEETRKKHNIAMLDFIVED